MTDGHASAMFMVNEMVTSLRKQLAEANAELEQAREHIAEIDASRNALVREQVRLRANQLPDGGTWDVEYLAPTGIGFVEATSEPTHVQRVWRGPVEPITDETTP